MKFGKLENLERVDWSIPEDCAATGEFLARQNVLRMDLQIFFGAPAWGHPTWVGKIYPADAKRSEYLSYYSRYFNCIELNTSHYRIPDAVQVRTWVDQVPESFLFCPKIFQGISHSRHGLLDRKLLGEWLSSIRNMERHLGPSFLQLPPHFDYSSKRELHAFLLNWPDEFPLAVEFRHPSWFEEGKIKPALAEYLQSRGIGSVITDVAGRRDVLHVSISADFCLLRFVGNGLHVSDFERARVWSERIAKWGKDGLRRIFLFIHEPDDVSVPEMSDFFLRALAEKGGWKFPSLPVLESQLGFNSLV